MSITYKCDGPSCATILADDTWRLEVSIANEPIEQTVSVDAEGDEYELAPLLAVASIGWNAQHHFCSMECLSTWAFAKGLNAAS